MRKHVRVTYCEDKWHTNDGSLRDVCQTVRKCRCSVDCRYAFKFFRAFVMSVCWYVARPLFTGVGPGALTDTFSDNVLQSPVLENYFLIAFMPCYYISPLNVSAVCL